MLWLLLALTSTSILYAQKFNSDDTIDDFSVIDDSIYVTTPRITYLLNSSFSTVQEFSKNFTKSLLLYVDSDFLFECGQRIDDDDDCCYLRDPLDLSSIQSNDSSNLCQQFVAERYHYPCYDSDSRFYILISYYSFSGSLGSFSRMYFPNLKNNQISFQEKRMSSIQAYFRPHVLSPAVGEFDKYVVIMSSHSRKSALYFDPDLSLTRNPSAELLCDGQKTAVSLGFGLKADTESVLGGNLTLTDMTHFILYEDSMQLLSYRICSFAEGLEMRASSNSNPPILEDVAKTPLFTFTTVDDKMVKSFNGRIINGGLAVFYSVGRAIYKIVMSKGDTQFRSLGIVFTASDDITKLEFLNDYLGYASTSLTIESYVLYKCGDHTDCQSCTELRDPHCGWCTLEHKCSTKLDCKVVPTLWTQEPSTQCLAISISEGNNDVMAGQNLIVSAQNIDLPTSLVYSCTFTSKLGEVVETDAAFSNTEIRCPVPQLANIQTGLMELDVSISYLSVPIGSISVRYHRCDLYTACSDCSSVLARFCSWCPLEGSCSIKGDALCNEYKVDDSAKCPIITGIKPTKISRDTITERVVIDVSYLPTYQVSDVYQCKITSRINNTYTLYYDINPKSSNTSIMCTNVQIDEDFPEYSINESVIDISIIYRGGTRKPGVDVVVGQFEVYACGLLASDCVQCVGTYSISEYSCRFCKHTCVYHNSPLCDNGTVIAGDSKQCLKDNTHIEQIIPDWSPGEGGVPIIITGKSLAVSDQQIDIQFVFAAKGDDAEKVVNCVNSRIENSTHLECKTPDIISELGYKSMYDQEIPSNVTISYMNSDSAKHVSNKVFTFTPLDIAAVTPDIGPESGGTLIKISGSRICVPGNTSVDVGTEECRDVSCNMTYQSLECVTPAGTGLDRNVTVYLGDAAISSTSHSYSYLADPLITGVSPNCALRQGGINITVQGSNFHTIQQPFLVISNSTNNDTLKSDEMTSDDVTCGDGDVTSFEAVERSDTELVYTLPSDKPDSYNYSFKMDGVAALCELRRTMEVLDHAPSVISSNFEDNNTLTCNIGSPCYVNMTMTQIHRFGDQVVVLVGNLPCLNATITNITQTTGQIGRFVCVVPTPEQIKESLHESHDRSKRAVLGDQETARFRVRIKIGRYEQGLGWLAFVEKGFQMIYIYIVAGVVLLFIVIFIVLVVKNRKDKHHMIDLEKKHQKEIDKVEACYTKAARQEFTELTLMTDHTANIKIDPRDIPFRIFCDYLVHIMFPNVDKKKILNNLQLEKCDVPDYQIQEFRQFLNNEQFLVTFIDVIERQREFQVAHRCEVASYLTVALYSDFNYLSHVLFRLLDKLIATDINKTPKLLLRSTKSVAEKLLTNWLSLSLYEYLCTVTGPSLYDLCYKISITVELGPLDYVTYQARYALSQDKILSEEVEFSVLEVQAEGPDGTRAKGVVTVLDCDTITQVKGKIYRAIYNHQPYSQQPPLETLSLLWTPSSGQGPGSMELCDFDERMSDLTGDKKFNTLKTYKVQSNDLLKLTMFNDYHQAPMSTIRSAKRQTVSEVCRYHLVKSNADMDFRSPAVNKRATTASTVTKIASEAFLPSLIRTKEHLNKVLDSMMTTIFMESNNIPAAIKYLFDYLDRKTELLPDRDRQDPEIAHVWKTNSLPLRFWINIIKNPQFLFDIEKPPIMDSYLSVIGQCFMDSFSLATMTLNKDSSANKLVYNREVILYRNTVDKWYTDVRQAPQVNLRTVVSDSKLPPLPFRSNFAVSQLFGYALKYQTDIAAALPLHGQKFTKSDFEVLTKPR